MAFRWEVRQFWTDDKRDICTGSLVADVGGGLRLDEATAGPQGRVGCTLLGIPMGVSWAMSWIW